MTAPSAATAQPTSQRRTGSPGATGSDGPQRATSSDSAPKRLSILSSYAAAGAAAPTNGNVVVTQGANVLRGDRMVVDLTTGVSRVESGQSKTGERQRVEGLFNPSSTPQPAGAQTPAPAAQKQPPPAPAAKPGAPTRSN